MKIRKIPALLLLVVLLLTLVFIPWGKNKEEEPILQLSDLAGRNLTVTHGSDVLISDALEEICPDATIVYTDNVQMAFSAVQNGSVDVYCAGRNYYEEAVEAGSAEGLLALEEPLKIFSIGLGLNEETSVDNYVTRVNEIIRTFQEDGTLDDMKQRWIIDKNEKMPELPEAENPEYCLKIVTYGQAKPYSFFSDNQLVGFDVELAYRVAAELNCSVKLDTAEYSSMLMGLSTGKYDMISANLYISEEREENVVYSEPYYTEEICCIVRDTTAETEKTDFFTNVSSSFLKTFVEDSRWKLLLSGLETTAIITFFGFLLANLFGIGFCACRMSPKKGRQLLANIYSRIMLGTPTVVVLLVLFYVIFGKSKISGVPIAILGFALDSGVALGQLFYGGITSIDRGQTEAALALGFTGRRALWEVILPQAIRNSVTEYFNTLIGFMKGTAIAGYVSVVDLTRAGNLIQSTTYEAFFPIISVALVYFLVTTLILMLARVIQKRLTPGYKKKSAAKKKGLLAEAGKAGQEK